MRHYFWVETEDEMPIETRMAIYSEMAAKAEDACKVRSSGCRTNLGEGLSILVNVGELL